MILIGVNSNRGEGKALEIKHRLYLQGYLTVFDYFLLYENIKNLISKNGIRRLHLLHPSLRELSAAGG